MTKLANSEGNGHASRFNSLEELPVLLLQGDFKRARNLANELARDGCPNIEIVRVCYPAIREIMNTDYGLGVCVANKFVHYGLRDLFL